MEEVSRRTLGWGMELKLVRGMEGSVDCVAALGNGVDCLSALPSVLRLSFHQCRSVVSWVRVSKASCVCVLEEALWWVLKSHLPRRVLEAKAQLQSLTSGTIAQSSKLN